ncbi:transcription elongation factor A protein 3-like isoform X6 [Ascaphus truei]|uniref:transcription elongation factor A protein 3-like isoform X6 n=1 Tax=Ascaphus truei TaxID=8439 RepID=UPI003F5ACAF3
MRTEEELLKIGRRLERRLNGGRTDKIMDVLKELHRFEMTVPLLRSTRIGVTVNRVRKRRAECVVAQLAKTVIKNWKRLLDKDKAEGAAVGSSHPAQQVTDRAPSSTHKKLHLEKARRYSTDVKSSNTTATRPASKSPETSPRPQSHQIAPKDPKLKRSHSTDVKSSSTTAKKPESKSPETSPRTQSHQTAPKDPKLKRSHSTNVKLSSPTAKRPERSHSTDVKPSSPTAKKPERRHSLGSPVSCNGSSKPATDTREERASGGKSPLSPVSSPLSPCPLSPSYLTGDSVRDKCVEMVTAALKTDDDYKQFGANCERIALDIEESIYRELKATDMKYRNRVRSRISNLKDPKNPNLRKNVLCGAVTPMRMASMTAEEMASDELKELRSALTQEAIREHQMAKTGGTQTDLLQCDKCRKSNCTYNQVQTRSADEPMTTFVLCNECGNRWKFC